MQFSLTGLIAAPYTPLHADGSLNVATIDRLAGSLIRNGVSGAFICGTTGEGLSLTLAERRTVAERWQAAAGEKLKVIVNTAHSCLEDSRALAAHAQRIGVAAIATMAPSFFKPAELPDLVDYCAAIASAAPELPFYFYHMPAMTGVCFPMASFLPLAAERIPNLAGVKFTYEDLMDYGRCLALQGGRFNMLFGRDEILLSALAMGARGAIGSTYNYAAPLYHRVINAFQAGDLAAARREQTRAMELVAILGKYGGLATGKTIMRVVGLDCGPMRLPLRALSAEQEHSLRADLDRIGAFEYLAMEE